VIPQLMIPLLVLGCKGGGVQISDVTLTPSPDVVTVATVRWTTSEAAASHVHFWTADRELDTPTETSPGTEHQAVLLGLTAGTDVQYQVVVDSDGSSSDTASFTTGDLPGELPSFAVSGEGQDSWLLTPIIGSATGPVMLSPEGQIVWYHVDQRGLDVYRVRPLADGSGVVYNAAAVSGDPADNSELVMVPWDGSQETSIAVPLLAHDFVELPEGGYAAIVVKYQDGPDGTPLRGDSIVEVAPDGSQTELWSTWDCFDPAQTPGDEPAIGWTFVNALDYDADLDAFRLSIRNFSSIVQVDRATGACQWAIGGQAASADLGADTQQIQIESGAFHHEHQFDLLDNGNLLVFDNAGAGGNTSRAIEYAIDWTAGTASEVWRYQPSSPTVYSFVLGDVHRYPDGDTFITWSVAGQMNRVTADGNVKWTLNSDLGYAFGFTSLMQTPYELVP